MAKSSYTIRMEFGTAEEQAKHLDEIARDLDRLADVTLGDTLSGIGNAWNSNNSVNYIKKGRKVQDELKNRSRELKNTASTIRSIAKNTYDAEMCAYNLAITRKY